MFSRLRLKRSTGVMWGRLAGRAGRAGMPLWPASLRFGLPLNSKVLEGRVKLVFSRWSFFGFVGCGWLRLPVWRLVVLRRKVRGFRFGSTPGCGKASGAVRRMALAPLLLRVGLLVEVCGLETVGLLALSVTGIVEESELSAILDTAGDEGLIAFKIALVACTMWSKSPLMRDESADTPIKSSNA
ncbi:hypothetical protein BC830DRAFT_26787 [Chytriomyces sp. MP71]|nr:hypothetical protein BC830DRAFT_26787 [Chytriomyces sp. MP71]